MTSPPPSTWADCVQLSAQPAHLDAYIRARLVELTKLDGAVSVRAIELLLEMGATDGASNPLAEVSTADLIDAEGRALAYLANLR